MDYKFDADDFLGPEEWRLAVKPSNHKSKEVERVSRMKTNEANKRK